MLKRALLCQSNPFFQRMEYSLVIRYNRRRSFFDKTTLIDDWVPRQRLYSKWRKPRQAEWSDPNMIFPKLIPPLYGKVSYKHFVKNTIEAEEKERLERAKEYIMRDIRSGDIIDITYQETFENDQTVTHRCYVLGFRRKNSLTAAIDVAIRFGGTSIKCIWMVHCPRIRKIQLISKGSGIFKSNIKHNWQHLTKEQLLNPRIKKKVMKKRVEDSKKKSSFNKKKVSFDLTRSDSVKKIL